jgi:hypothetical protein
LHRFDGSLFQHGGEAKELAVRGLVNNDLLTIFVDGRDADAAGHHHVGLTGLISDFVDALARSKMPHLDLTGENSGFLVIQQRKQRNMLQFLGFAGHWPPRREEGSLKSAQRIP